MGPKENDGVMVGPGEGKKRSEEKRTDEELSFLSAFGVFTVIVGVKIDGVGWRDCLLGLLPHLLLI